MIKIHIPTLSHEIDAEGETKDFAGEITATVDVTINAEARWEKYFPEQAGRETLANYAARVKNEIDNVRSGGGSEGMALIMSAVKVLYCVIEMEDDIGFKNFCDVFMNVTDQSVAAAQLKVLRAAFALLERQSVATPKN